MKKLVYIILAVAMLFTVLSACGETDSSTPSSSQSEEEKKPSSSQSEEESMGLAIEYSSVAKGYINHIDAYESSITEFNGFECMDGEYLLLPAGTIVECDTRYALYCYTFRDNELILDTPMCRELGQSILEADVTFHSNPITLTADTIVRISVRGTLAEDVKIYVAKELESKVKLGTAEEFLATAEDFITE